MEAPPSASPGQGSSCKLHFCSPIPRLCEGALVLASCSPGICGWSPQQATSKQRHFGKSPCFAARLGMRGEHSTFWQPRDGDGPAPPLLTSYLVSEMGSDRSAWQPGPCSLGTAAPLGCVLSRRQCASAPSIPALPFAGLPGLPGPGQCLKLCVCFSQDVVSALQHLLLLGVLRSACWS